MQSPVADTGTRPRAVRAAEILEVQRCIVSLSKGQIRPCRAPDVPFVALRKHREHESLPHGSLNPKPQNRPQTSKAAEPNKTHRILNPKLQQPFTSLLQRFHAGNIMGFILLIPCALCPSLESPELGCLWVSLQYPQFSKLGPF